MPPPRKRADVLLVERGLFESRARARAAIEAGLVIADDKPVTKPPTPSPPTRCCRRSRRIPLSRAAASSFRGALEQYPIDIEGHVCLDVGASTGGFTEVLLANGAAMVFAIDVGREPVAPVAAWPFQDRFHGERLDIRNFEGKRLPARPDRRRHRRQLYLAEGRAAGGAVAGRRRRCICSR